MHAALRHTQGELLCRLWLRHARWQDIAGQTRDLAAAISFVPSDLAAAPVAVNVKHSRALCALVHPDIPPWSRPRPELSNGAPISSLPQANTAGNPSTRLPRPSSGVNTVPVGRRWGYHDWFRRLSSRRLRDSLRLRFSLLLLVESLAPALEMTTG